MSIKIHGRKLSPFVLTVLNVCKEVGVTNEFITVAYDDGVTKTEDYLNNMQPFGQVPVMFDGEFRLYESRAIARYLVRKYGADTGLLPKQDDVEKEALFEQAASIEQFDWHPNAGPLAVEVFFKPKFRGAQPDEARKEELLGKLKNTLKGYERILAKQKFLAGDVATLADIFHLPFGVLIGMGGVDLLTNGEYPNVTRWWKDISSRPAWIEIFAEWEKVLLATAK